jgi:hypothetical protein
LSSNFPDFASSECSPVTVPLPLKNAGKSAMEVQDAAATVQTTAYSPSPHGHCVLQLELIRGFFGEFVFRSEFYAVLSVSTTGTNPIRFQNLVVTRAWVRHHGCDSCLYILLINPSTVGRPGYGRQTSRRTLERVPAASTTRGIPLVSDK